MSQNYINHIDGSRLNNNASNLEWCDHKVNNNHAFDNDLIQTGRKVVLVDKATKETHYFRSLAKTDEFLGAHPGYLSERFIKGNYEIDGYMVFMEQR